jgi:MFS family permease
MAPNLFIVTPRYLRGFGQDERHIGMIMGAFPLASLLCMPVWARVAERRGARFVMTAGAALVALGCAAYELAHALPSWMATRALQGLGWSGVLVSSSLAATLLAPPRRMAQALGIAGVLTLLAMAIGPLAGEALVTRAGWPWVFRGAALASVAGLVLARSLPRLRQRGFTHEDASTPAPAGPRLAPGQLRPLAATLLVATGFGAVVSFLADHTALVGHFGVTPFFDAYVASAMLVRLTAGHLPDRVGPYPIIVPAFVGQALSLAGLSLLSARWQLWPIGAVFGVTHGLYYPALQALVVDRSPPARRARAVASAHFAFALGMVLAAFGCGALAEQHGYDAVYLTVAGAALAGVAVMAADRVLSRA